MHGNDITVRDSLARYRIHPFLGRALCLAGSWVMIERPRSLHHIVGMVSSAGHDHAGARESAMTPAPMRAQWHRAPPIPLQPPHLLCWRWMKPGKTISTRSAARTTWPAAETAASNLVCNLTFNHPLSIRAVQLSKVANMQAVCMHRRCTKKGTLFQCSVQTAGHLQAPFLMSVYVRDLPQCGFRHCSRIFAGFAEMGIDQKYTV